MAQGDDDLADISSTQAAPIAQPAALSSFPSSTSPPPDAPMPALPSQVLLPASASAQVSPIRPATVRKAEDAATPGDKARETEEAAERRARRKASIDGFDERDWPPLVRSVQEPTGLAAHPDLQPFNHTKQLTLRPGHPAARTRALAPVPTGAEQKRGPSSVPTTAIRTRPPPPPFALPTSAPRTGQPGPEATPAALDAQSRLPISQKVPQRRQRSLTIGDVFAVKQEHANSPTALSAEVLDIPDTHATPAPTPRPLLAPPNGGNDSAWAMARNIAMKISARMPDPSQPPQLPTRSLAPSPADPAVPLANAGAQDPARAAHHTQMDVDEEDDADLYVQEEPAAQRWPMPSDDEASDAYDGASIVGSTTSEPDTQLHHAFDERTVNITCNGDNALLDGMEQNGHLAHMLPSQLKAWDDYDGHKAIFICDDLDGLDPDTMNPVAAVKKLVKQFQGAWPGSNPEISRAAQDPTSTGKVRKNTFLVKNISADQQEALEYRRHYVIGTAKITTFSFRIPVSPFMGTVPETTLEATQVRDVIVQRWATEPGVIAIFDKHLKHKASSAPLRRRFFKYLRVTPMVTKAQGEHITEFNIYADAQYLSPALHAELRAALKTILIIDNFAGIIALKDPDWKCTACPSRGHPRGLCKTHDVEGWHPPPPSAPASQAAAAARGGPPSRGMTHGNRGTRGGRGGGRGRGF